MDVEKFRDKKVLLCVLNWGLGHAVRSMALYNKIKDHASEITIASDGLALIYLQQELPQIQALPLPGYNIRYSHRSIVWDLVIQANKIRKAIVQENRTISDYASQYDFDTILSDNRYGCYNKDCDNIFITHQTQLIHSNKIVSSTANLVNSRFIHRFDHLYIPDYEGDESLSGKLSKTEKIHLPKTYIGPLSEFSLQKDVEKKYRIAVILSGPEPQRTNLEKIVLRQLEEIDGQHILIKGVPSKPSQHKNIHVLGLIGRNRTEEIIQESNFVVSRSGYTSLMDYEALGISALLIPTPGQTEQEYLAQRMANLGKHFFQKQSQIDINKYITGEIKKENYEVG